MPSALPDITAEQLNVISEIYQDYIDLQGVTGDTNLDIFLRSIMHVHGSPETNTDATRKKRWWVETTTGTVGEVDAAGVYQGIDFNEDRIVYETTGTMIEMGTYFKTASRNFAQLRQFISAIETTTEGQQEAARTFTRKNYGAIIDGWMRNAMITRLKKDLQDLLDAGENDTVFGDTIFAHTGPLNKTDNLINGGMSKDAIDTLVNRAHQAVDYQGNTLTFTQPKFFLVDSNILSKTISLLKNSMTVNETHRNILDLWNNDALVVPIKTAVAGDGYAFTSDPPIVFLVETVAPQSKIAEDDFGNPTWMLSHIYKFMWKSKVGGWKIKAAV